MPTLCHSCWLAVPAPGRRWEAPVWKRGRGGGRGGGAPPPVITERDADAQGNEIKGEEGSAQQPILLRRGDEAERGNV